MAAEGIANARIASEVGTTTTSVWKWRNRYAEAGLAGLADAERSGRPKQVDDERIITAT
jgi:transposase